MTSWRLKKFNGESWLGKYALRDNRRCGLRFRSLTRKRLIIGHDDISSGSLETAIVSLSSECRSRQSSLVITWLAPSQLKFLWLDNDSGIGIPFKLYKMDNRYNRLLTTDLLEIVCLKSMDRHPLATLSTKLSISISRWSSDSLEVTMPLEGKSIYAAYPASKLRANGYRSSTWQVSSILSAITAARSRYYN